MIPFNLIINSLYEFSQITLAERSGRTCYPFGDQIEPKHETRKCSKQKRNPNFGSSGWTLKWSFKKVCCIDDSLSFVSFRVNLFMRTCALIMKSTWKISDIPTDRRTQWNLYKKFERRYWKTVILSMYRQQKEQWVYELYRDKKEPSS